MNEAPGAGDVTALLRAWSGGDRSVADRLMRLVYDELHRRARAYLRRERRNHTLQPTALVNEAYLRLIDQRQVVWQNRAQFFGIAAQMMRRILVDHGRAGKMAKRSGRWLRVSLDDHLAQVGRADAEILDLDAALTRLAAIDERKSRIAELRFFGGLSLEETSELLGISVPTVQRDWHVARAWLKAALSGTLSDEPGSLATRH